ncbi:phospholipase/carboxylesterase family protein [Blattabacterium sp. (Blattella germanica) str. Bge]|uniref:alpha/beta hydrolase n=1 Tax=Blattabacterium sp. (Blattella germanica) TaxID=624186 RepID=UPI0001BB6287|nr:phospholipase [Blattabacterium sp. (Blattella germanica)]ACY40593.1 phospholipase/carboxylesterase family protein [Blattabacterium sp. (Blattella germanica) str. Bge]
MLLNNQLKNQLSIKHIIKKPANENETTLFLMIHGYGSNERDLFYFKKDIPENLFIISIQGLYPIGTDKYSWYDIDFSNEKKFINILQAKKTIEKISFFIDEAIQEYELKKNQVWLCGFSQGAILSYAIALKNTNKIKKVIALSGYLEESILPIETNPNIYTNLEFFISHGKYDTVIPLNWTKKGLKFLKKKKILSLYYKEYESGHSLNSLNYQDLVNWIKKKHIYSDKKI